MTQELGTWRPLCSKLRKVITAFFSNLLLGAVYVLWLQQTPCATQLQCGNGKYTRVSSATCFQDIFFLLLILFQPLLCSGCSPFPFLFAVSAHLAAAVLLTSSGSEHAGMGEAHLPTRRVPFPKLLDDPGGSCPCCWVIGSNVDCLELNFDASPAASS